MAGTFLVTSVVAACLAGESLTHSLLTTAKLSQQFALAVEASIESLAFLQRQLTSLDQVALQNRRTLDLLTAEKGGTCLFLQEECCFYVDHSRLVKDSMPKVREGLAKQKREREQSQGWFESWFNSSLG